MTSRFVPLHLHTETSFLDALSRPKELVARAKALEYPAIAITDHGNVHNFIHVYQACKTENIKFIPGCEFYFTHQHSDKEQKSYHLTILAKNNEGLKNLYKLLTWANIPVDQGGGFYYKPRISWHELRKYNEGLICLSGCMNSPVNRAFLEEGYELGCQIAKKFKSVFRTDFYVELQYVKEIPEHKKLLKWNRRLAKDLGIVGVATNDCHYILPEDKEVHDVMKGVGRESKYNGNEYYMKSEAEMLETFTKDEVFASGEIAKQCDVRIPLKKNHMPRFDPTLNQEQVYEKLLREVKKGWKFWKIDEKNDIKKYRLRLKTELADVKEAGLANYFMIVWDVMQFAHNNNIGVSFGRGSVGGSLVAYLLKIHVADPIEHGLIWERFWNRGRKGSMPDIDIDIDPIRRDEVIEYLRNKFGRNKVFPMMTVTRMTARVAVKDVGRSVGLPFSYMNAMTKQIDKKAKTINEAVKKSPELADITKGNDADVKKWKKEVAVLRAKWRKNKKETGKRNFEIEGKASEIETKIAERSRLLIKTFKVVNKLEGTARQRSKHACALLISDKAIFGRIPLTWDSKHKSLLTGFDMYDMEKMGYLKLDILGLANASVINRILPKGIYDILDVGFEDKKTYKIIGMGRCKGIFQFEKHLGVDWCQKMKPRNLEEIAALSAILRPGPLITGLSAKYLKNRKNGKWEYIHPDLKPVLKNTYGVMVFQEQLIEIVKRFAGYDLAKADEVRKACGKKLPEEMAKHKKSFIEGCKKNGYDQELADELWRWIEATAGYQFNKSHALAYGMMTYATAYLKANYPGEFFTTLLQLSDFGNSKQREEISELFYDAKLFGIEIKGPTLKRGNEDFELHNKKIYFGLKHIRGIGNSAIKELKNLKNASWPAVIDVRKKLKQTVVEALIFSGAFDSYGMLRSQLKAGLDFANKLTPREYKIFQSLLLSGKSVELGRGKTVCLGRATSFKGAVKKMVEFLEDENTRLKAINKNRSEIILNACYDFLSVEDEVEKRSKAAQEIFYLGIPATCSEVDIYKHENSTHKCIDIKRENDNVEISTVALIMGVNKHMTRNGNNMVFVKMADRTYMLEGLMFSDSLAKCEEILSEESVVLFEGIKRKGTFVIEQVKKL